MAMTVLTNEETCPLPSFSISVVLRKQYTRILMPAKNWPRPHAQLTDLMVRKTQIINWSCTTGVLVVVLICCHCQLSCLCYMSCTTRVCVLFHFFLLFLLVDEDWVVP